MFSVKTITGACMIMSSSSVDEPPHDKEEKIVSMSPLCPLSSLPYEVALSCLAQLSRSDRVALSLVSKRYHSLVLSPDFYNIRSLMGRTEKCLYVCLRMHYDSTPRWYFLRREKSNSRLIPVPLFPSHRFQLSSVVVLDWGIYVIGGNDPTSTSATSDVLLLDCRNNTWRHVPSMRVARANPAAGVINGKIYVFGGCGVDHNSSSWGEVFDPKTQTWDDLSPLPDTNRVDGFIRESLVIDEKVYAVPVKNMERSVYYSPSEGKWGRKEQDSSSKLGIVSHCCTNDKLLYACDSFGKIFWRKLDELEWKKVKGLADLRIHFPRPRYVRGIPSYDMLPRCSNKVINFGVNIVLVWFKYNYMKVDIWCVEISFERREEKGEVWGTVESSKVVVAPDNYICDFEILYSASVNIKTITDHCAMCYIWGNFMPFPLVA